MHEARVFSTLDLRRAYNLINVAESDIPKTAIITPLGLYEYLKMPFGLRNSGSTFQRSIDIVLRGLDFTFGYMDDVLVASKDEAEHEIHLRQVLQRLHDANFQLNLQKCHFFETEVLFLGQTISAEGIKPPKERIEDFCELPLPADYKSLRSYVGAAGFYSRFIPNYGKIVVPLQELLHRYQRKERYAKFRLDR